MSIFDFFRMQNAMPPVMDSGYGGQGSFGGQHYDYGPDAGQQQPMPTQAPAPPTRQPLPTRDISGLDSIINAQQPTTNPYSQYGYPGLYNMAPDPNVPRPELEKYSQMLDQYPDRPTPSWMRTIATGALSYSNAQEPDQVVDQIGPNGRITRTIHHGIWKPMDINESNKVLQMPYEQDLADYQNKLKARAAGAALERQTLTDKSLAAQRGSQVVKNIGSTIQGQENVDIRADRVKVAAFSAITRARAEQFNEATKDMTDSEREQYRAQNGIDLQTLRDADALKRVQLQQSGALQREREQQGGALQREREQQSGATQREREAQAAATGRQTDKQQIGQLPSQQKVATQLRATQLIRQHPEWANYISIDQNGMVQVEPPSSGFFGGGLDQNTYNQIVNALNPQATVPNVQPQTPPEDFVGPQAPPATTKGKGGKTIPSPSTGINIHTQPLVKQQKNVNTGETRTVYSYDGGKTWSPQ